MGCDLSVIVVNWNTRDLLSRCIESIHRHTRRLSYEIIVVDNASEDGSPEMAEKRFPEVTLIKNDENRGFGRANNQGLALAQGRYVLFLNSDAEVDPGCLDGLFMYMEQNPAVGASACRLLNPEGSLQHSCRKFPDFRTFLLLVLGLRSLFPRMKIFRNYLMLDWDHADLREVDQIMGSFMFLRREVLDRIGGFDEQYWMYFEEVDLCLRIWKAGWTIVHYPYASAVHHLSRSSEQWGEAKRSVEFHRSLLKYFKKNKTFPEYFVLFILTQIKFLFLLPRLKPGSRRLN